MVKMSSTRFMQIGDHFRVKAHHLTSPEEQISDAHTRTTYIRGHGVQESGVHGNNIF